MDITDEEGDRAAGIATLPVMLGGRGALLVALGCVCVGAAAALWKTAAAVAAVDAAAAVAAGAGAAAAAAGGVNTAALAAPAAVIALATARFAALAVGIWRSGFDYAVMSAAIEECLKPVGLSLLLLAALVP
jgi:hypothetical protein